MKAMLPDAVRRRFDPAERYGLRLTLFAFAIVLVAVPFGWLLEQVVSHGPMLRVDRGVAQSAHDFTVARGPGFVRFVHDVSRLGWPPLLGTLVLLAVLYVVVRHRGRLALFIVATTLGGGIVDTAVKVLVNRDRPELADPIATAHGKSFPSGHAMSSTVVYGTLLLVFLPLVPRRARPWAVGATALLVVTVASSRIALGVHFLSDVLAGLALGLAWLAASVAAFRIWRTERGRRPAPVTAGVEPEAAKDLAPTSR